MSSFFGGQKGVSGCSSENFHLDWCPVWRCLFKESS